MTGWAHKADTQLPVYKPYGASNGPTHVGQAIKAWRGKVHGSSRIWWMNTLIAMCILVLIWNFLRLPGGHPANAPAGMRPASGSRSQQAAAAAAAAAALAATTPTNFPAAHLQHLVLVAGHAVYTGVDYHSANKESSWFLEEYQKVPGEAQSFLDHIRLGIEAAAKDPKALLLFSGGQTRQAAGPRSEGLSYWVVAEAADWFGHKEVRSRAYTEEHARDSFENVLFSLCRFYELTGHYPAAITAVSYTLKQRRFEEVHRAAVRFPASNFTFIGTPVPPAAKGAEAGEAATVAGFRADPYGCSGKLKAKKAQRDPFAVGPIHPSRCPDMASLLGYCGRNTFPGPLPWDPSGRRQAATSKLKQGRVAEDGMR